MATPVVVRVSLQVCSVLSLWGP